MSDMASQQSGFVYDGSSGLYYDVQTGMYYDQVAVCVCACVCMCSHTAIEVISKFCEQETLLSTSLANSIMQYIVTPH